MKTKFQYKNFEKGQILPFVVLGLTALVIMVALIIDGAMILSHRRAAQAAADAAALAGAEFLCPDPATYDINTAEAQARQYVALNNAIVVEPITFPDANTIHVETSYESVPFFSRIMNQTSLTANAMAEARCSPASSFAGVLPISYPCASISGGAGMSDSADCLVRYYDFNQSVEQNIVAGRMFMIMDSDPSTFYCNEPPGDVGEGLDCDLNDDGINDILDQDRKGWLSLDGSTGSAVLKDWLINGYDGEIGIGYWIGNQPGITAASLGVIKDYLECSEPISNWENCKQYFVPIFNHLCEVGPPSIVCPLAWEPGDIEILRPGEDQVYYRIAAGAKVSFTCSHVSGSDKHGNSSRCPFRQYLIDNYGWNAEVEVKTHEGFFVQGAVFTAGGDPNALDFGAYAVNLIK